MQLTYALVALLAATVQARGCGLKIAPCDAGQECVPNDPECTNTWRCLGTCQPIGSVPDNPVPLPVPEEEEPIPESEPQGNCGPDQEFVANDLECEDADNCPGTCQKVYDRCGGRTVRPNLCKNKEDKCWDDPRKPGNCGQACDIPGICLPKKPKECGGFLGAECADGTQCVDDPRDDCDPMNGGADCMGICV